VREENLAIVFGIPVSAGEFESRRESAAGWDYGDQLGARSDGGRDSYFSLYGTIAGVATELVRQATAMGAGVWSGAGLQDLRSALATHTAVILLAHWRGSNISESDLLPGWHDRVTDLLKSDCAPLGIVLRNADLGSELFRPEVFVRALNMAIERGAFRCFFPHGLGQRVALHKRVSETLSRDMVDAALKGCIRPGNLLELFDGLHAAGVLVDTVPSSFHGVLDLSCCNSSVPATLLRFERGDAFSIFSNDNLLPPVLQMELIYGTLKMLADAPKMDYWDARFLITKGLGAWRRAHRSLS
jgi:hypothetical protein